MTFTFPNTFLNFYLFTQISSPRFSSSSDSNSPSYQTHTEDKERQFHIIHLDKSTQTGHTYYLEMSFNGPLKDDMKGFYLSSFKQGDKTRLVIKR